MRYIIFNSPCGVLSQFTASDGQKNLSHFHLPPHVYPAGRLDKDSEGLILLTNDGPFIHHFLKHHQRVYLAQVEGVITDQAIAQLKAGVQLKDGLTAPCLANKLGDHHPHLTSLPPRFPPIRYRKNRPTSWLQLALYQGRNRQVRRMTASVGFPTLRLVRVALGQFSLFDSRAPAPGKWCEVKKSQITGES